jgi:hypothetical protein
MIPYEMKKIKTMLWEEHFFVTKLINIITTNNPLYITNDVS